MFKLVFNTNSITKQIKQLEKQLLTHRSEVVVPYYFQKLQGIAARAAEIGRIQIKLATTNTGKKRAAERGGDPGRIETGKFYNGFTWRVVSESKGVYQVKLGWLDGEPDWASYQELGFQHRSGMYVTGADALGAAQRYAENELAKLRKQ